MGTNVTIGPTGALVTVTDFAVNGSDLALTVPAGGDVGVGGTLDIVIDVAAKINNGSLNSTTNTLTVKHAGQPDATSANFTICTTLSPCHLGNQMNVTPNEPGVVAQYQLQFVTNVALQANIDTIVVLFDKDVGIPTSMSKGSVVLSASVVTDPSNPGQAVSPTLDPQFRLVPGGEGAVEYTVTIPTMDTTLGAPVSTIDKGATVTVTFLTGAGFTNPQESITFGGDRVKVKTNLEPEYGPKADGQKIELPLQLSLDDVADRRDKPLTVFGKGFKGGTSATIWLDVNKNGKRDTGETDLITVPIASSCDCFDATFVVTVPPFKAGSGNFINAVDGENSAIATAFVTTGTTAADIPNFKVDPLLKITPSTAGVGDTIQLALKDWGNGTIGADCQCITIAGVIHDPTALVTVSGGEATFDVVIGNAVPIGTQKLVLNVKSTTPGSTALGKDDGLVTISSAILILTPESVVANQTLSVIGQGFSRTSGTTINDTVNNETDSETGESPSLISLGGTTAGLKATNVGTRTTINNGDVIDVDNGGNWSASIIIPINSTTTTAGTHQLKVIDSFGREGIANLIIPERTLVLDPIESRVGTTVRVSGTGYPANNTKSGSESVPTIKIEYTIPGQLAKNVLTVTPDASGNFSSSFQVPLNAAIPSTNTVRAVFELPNSTTEVTTVATHEVPRAEITLSTIEGRPGSIVTITGFGFKGFTSLKELLIGDLDVLPSPKPSTGNLGTFTATFIVPQLDTGTQSVKAKVGDTTASASFRIIPLATTITGAPTVSEPPEVAFGDIIANNDNLLRGWHFNPATQNVAPDFGWFLYDPRPVFAAANTYASVESGDFLWLLVRDAQQATICNLSRPLFGGWNPVVC
ncbi:MAG: hypothetical protein IIC96_11160 [Chloroflexi bacterium]|nr:hypothetical protein [Chloroflexota bacterium]